jgi:hypothetical protein
MKTLYHLLKEIVKGDNIQKNSELGIYLYNMLLHTIYKTNKINNLEFILSYTCNKKIFQ